MGYIDSVQPSAGMTAEISRRIRLLKCNTPAIVKVRETLTALGYKFNSPHFIGGAICHIFVPKVGVAFYIPEQLPNHMKNKFLREWGATGHKIIFLKCHHVDVMIQRGTLETELRDALAALETQNKRARK